MTNLANVPSRYRTVNIPSGFVIEGGENRNSVRVRLRQTHWEVQLDGELDLEKVSVFSLVQTKQLIDRVAALVFSEYKTNNAAIAPYRLKHWMISKSIGSIGKAVYEKINELQPDRKNQKIFNIQRKVFASAFAVPNLLLNRYFYEFADKYLIDDLFRYRAAGKAIHIFGDAFYNSAWDLYINEPSALTDPLNQRQAVRIACDQLRNWRSLFSYNGRSYPNLNRTLDQLPGGISNNLLKNLRSVKLKRVVTDRPELIVILLGNASSFQNHGDVLHFATRREIIQAMNRVSIAMQTPLSHRSTAHLDTFVRYLNDYPDVHEGGIVGLANKSIQYHLDLVNQTLADIDTTDMERELAKPPIPVPSVAGLRFLSTSQEVLAEGMLMGHCIGRYIELAERGECYLFHYEDGGQSASIQVDPYGKVIQSRGPRNTQNEATKRAQQILSRWGRKFPLLCESSVASSMDFFELHDAPF